MFTVMGVRPYRRSTAIILLFAHKIELPVNGCCLTDYNNVFFLHANSQDLLKAWIWNFVCGFNEVDANANSVSPRPAGNNKTNTDILDRGHSLKLVANRSRLSIRQNFFSQRVVRSWNCLQQNVGLIDAPSVNSFKNRLNKFWKSAGYGH